LGGIDSSAGRALLLACVLALRPLGCAEERPAFDDDASDDDHADDDTSASEPLPTCADSVTGAFAEDEIDPPQPDSEGYTPPTDDDLQLMRDTLQDLLAGQNASALAGVEQLGYELCAGDADDDGLVLMRPQARGAGHALFAWRTAAARPLILGSPHSWLELGTLDECVEAFQQVQARLLIATGTHRCANTAPAGCDGSTEVCGAYEPYRESDMAHVVGGFYQVFHEVFADHFADDWVLSVHGFPFFGISVSNGTHDAAAEGTPVALFGAALMEQYPDERVTSCSDWPGADVDYRYCGTTNVQGRYVNGSPDPCFDAADTASERFIHLEQFFTIWLDPQPVIDALDSVVPEAAG